MLKGKKLQFLAYDLGKSTDVCFIALVVGPLPDAPDFDQAHSLQRRKVIGHGRLRQADAFLNATDADAHRMNVPFILWREVLHRILQPLENFKARTVREGFEYFDQFHESDNIEIYRYVNEGVNRPSGMQSEGCCL